MVFKTKVLGRQELIRRIRQLAPNALDAMEKAKLEVVDDAAAAIAARAPFDQGEYKKSIRGGYQRDNPDKDSFGHSKSKDPSAAGVYGDFIWRFLEFGTAAGIRGHRAGSSGGDVKQNKTAGRFNRRSHPGTVAQPHIFPTWRAMKPKAQRKIRNALNRAVRKTMGK